MDNISDLLKKIHDTEIFSLPIGVYAVTKEGLFVKVNEKIKDILCITKRDLFNKSIKDFYFDKYQREILRNELEKLERENLGYIENKVVAFKVLDKKKWIQLSCCSIRNHSTKEILGYIGCMIDITEEKEYIDLLEIIPAGIYQLDANDRFTRINNAVAKIFGYDSVKEIIGESVKKLYVDSKDAERFRKKLEIEEIVIDERLGVKKKYGESFFVSASAKKILDAEGNYIGRGGSFIDITNEELYRRNEQHYRNILDVIPVGTYIINCENGFDIITACNDAFAKIFGYDSVKEVIGKDVRDFYLEPKKTYHRFVNELYEKDKLGEPLIGFVLKAVRKDNKPIDIEINCKSIKNGNIITGRAGVIREVTNEVSLRELKEDIGRILHSYSSCLMMLSHCINPIFTLLGPDPISDSREANIEKINIFLDEPAYDLSKSMDKLLDIANYSTERIKALTEENWNELIKLNQFLKDYKNITKHPEFFISFLLEISKKIFLIMNNIKKGFLPKELVKEIIRKCKDLEKICCILWLHEAQSTIIEMDHQVQSLREYVTWQGQRLEPKRIYKISWLISQANSQLVGYANSKNVKIKREDFAKHVRIFAHKQSIIRALVNLLHNAIKYSFSKSEEKKAHVWIRSYVLQNKVVIVYENYGVAIPRNEIDDELIFKIGYRGRRSSDRGRLGTGIGLTDVKETVNKHGGKISVISYPACEEDLKKAYITKIKIQLPIYNPNGDSNEK